MGLEQRWRFLRGYLQTPHVVGALSPSSKQLAEALCAPYRRAESPVSVLEVGAGTGAITRYLGTILRDRDRLDTRIADIVERNRPRVSMQTPLSDLIAMMVDPEFECLPILEGGVIRGVVYVAEVFRAAADLALTPETSGIRIEKRDE